MRSIDTCAEAPANTAASTPEQRCYAHFEQAVDRFVTACAGQIDGVLLARFRERVLPLAQGLIDGGDPIVLMGQCSDEINAIDNGDAALGPAIDDIDATWREIPAQLRLHRDAHAWTADLLILQGAAAERVRASLRSSGRNLLDARRQGPFDDGIAETAVMFRHAATSATAALDDDNPAVEATRRMLELLKRWGI